MPCKHWCGFVQSQQMINLDADDWVQRWSRRQTPHHYESSSSWWHWYVFTSWQANSGSFEEVALGIRVILYLDNILILSTTREGAKKGLAVVLEFFVALGFVVNTKKSVMDPTQLLEFLGFVIDSQWMIISLPIEKLKSTRKLAEEIHQQAHCSVRKMAQLREWCWQLTQQSWQLPFITDVWRGWECRPYDRAKLRGTTSSESECPEGVDLMDKEGSSVQRQILVHYTMGPHNRNRCIHQRVGRLFPGDDHGGVWTAAERLSHINYLELYAAFPTLKFFWRTRGE